jgi:hypothetical protein
LKEEIPVRRSPVPATEYSDKNHDIYKMDFIEYIEYITKWHEKEYTILTEVLDKSAARSIPMATVYERLANFNRFMLFNVTIYQVFKYNLEVNNSDLKSLEDTIYMDIKSRVVDPLDDMGKRYLKKAATIDEVKREAVNHPKNSDLTTLKSTVRDLSLKVSAQRRYLDTLKKWDTNLQSIKKENEKEANIFV